MNEIVNMLEEIIFWLLGIEKNKPTSEKGISDQQLPPADRVRKESTPKVEPITRQRLTPSFQIDPKQFFRWAGQDIERWKLLIGAEVSHANYGYGTIKRIYRAAQNSKIIFFSIFLERFGSKEFYVSDFNMPDKPFVELLVNSKYHEVLQGNSYTPIITNIGSNADNKSTIPHRETVIKPPADLSCWKENWNEFVNVLSKYQIRFLYHFTDEANIPSILKHRGLFSWWYCQNNGIVIPRPGGDNLSRRLDHGRNLHDYVRLSFNDNQPMLAQAKFEGRIKNPFILKINPEVIVWKTTMFSDTNATANYSHIGQTFQDFQRINFDIISHHYYTEATKSFYQAEVLVKTCLPIEYILNLS